MIYIIAQSIEILLLGIQSSVPESEFDLSLIVQEQSTKKTGTPIEQEEILPDQEEVEEKVEEKEEIERGFYI